MTQKKQSYHHGSLRDSLIQAGLALIEEQGVTALSLRQVARQAQVSQTAPYRHFTDKTALLAALATEGFIMLRDYLIRYSDAIERNEQRNQYDRISGLGKGYVQFSLDHPGLLHLMFSPEIVDKSVYPELCQASEAAYSQIGQAVADYIQGQQSSNTVPTSPNAELATVAAWSLVHGLSHILINRQLDPLQMGLADTDKLVELVTGVLISGMRQR